jgi:ComF family protein
MHFTDYLRGEVSGCIALFLPLACPWCGSLLSAGSKPPDLCHSCLEGIQPPGPAFCPRCMQPHATLSATGHLCQACLCKPPPFDRVHVVGRHAGTLKQAIHRFKYRDDPALNASLGHLLFDRLQATLDGFRPDLVMPVPVHPQRLRERGYNQALELARPVAKNLKVPLRSDLLHRTRAASAQQSLNALQRHSNLRGAFSLDGRVTARQILLIDDVMTTTATARACCAPLRDGGARAIHVAVLGRA